MQSFNKKVAIVTGGVSGIGLACVNKLLSAGAYVVVADIDHVKGKILQDENSNVLFRKTDVTRFDEMQELIHQTYLEFEKIDFMVCSAGIEGDQDFIFDQSVSNWHKVIDVNLNSVFYALKLVSPFMIQQKQGVIVNISSVCGVRGTPKLSPYSTAKAGVLNLFRTAAIELAPFGIRVNNITPSIVETPLLENFIENSVNPEQMKDALHHYNPIPGIIPADHIADTLLFLLSDAAKFITGISLPVDGGFTAR
jgi:NAD(P)-dependent dehydrogenase (short-subunit alcohol dehydrogenase family)